MNWILEHLQVLIGVAAAIAYFLNRRKQSAADDEPARPAPVSDANTLEQDERTRRVQAEIRRKVAERRGTTDSASATPASRSRIPPLVPPSRVPPLDPFGGPMRRILRKIEEAGEPPAAASPTQESTAVANELARQKILEERMREIEALKIARENQPRIEARAILKRGGGFGERVTVTGKGQLRDVLRDPGELRRAVILREILGPPVGLR